VWRRHADRFDAASVGADFLWRRQVRRFKDFFYMKNDPWRWRGIPAVNGEVYGTAVDLDHSAVSTSLVVAFAGVGPRRGRSVSRIYHPDHKTILRHHEDGKYSDREDEPADHDGRSVT
jgi:hypothetical protein